MTTGKMSKVHAFDCGGAEETGTDKGNDSHMMHVLFKGSWEAFPMAMVKCDVCGGTFSQRYLTSHKRLAHRKGNGSAASSTSEDEAVQAIVSLYERLSAKGRMRVLWLLTEKDNKGKEIQQG